MPPPFSRLLPPLVNGRSAAAAAVLLPPAPPACFYGNATSAMYQSSMRKRRAGSSAMTDAVGTLDGGYNRKVTLPRAPRLQRAALAEKCTATFSPPKCTGTFWNHE